MMTTRRPETHRGTCCSVPAGRSRAEVPPNNHLIHRNVTGVFDPDTGGQFADTVGLVDLDLVPIEHPDG